MPFSESCPPGCTCKKHLGGKRKQRVATTCLECGKVELRSPCFADRKFCGRQCANLYNSRDKRRREVKECAYSRCDVIFESQVYQNQKFCSAHCLNEHKKEEKRVELVCQREGCGATYWRHRQRATSSLYCSDKCKSIARADRLKYRRAQGFRPWDVSPEEYEARLAAQNNVCAICQLPETQRGRGGEVLAFSRDHCHRSGKFRGLLCRRCNMALGLFAYDAASLLRAADYVVNGGIGHEPAATFD